MDTLHRKGCSQRAIAKRLAVSLGAVQHWLQRAQAGEPLHDLSCAPLRQAAQTEAHIEALICELRVSLLVQSDLGFHGPQAIAAPPPTYEQFDNDTRFQGPHNRPNVIGEVIRFCLRVGVTPVFALPTPGIGRPGLSMRRNTVSTPANQGLARSSPAPSFSSASPTRRERCVSWHSLIRYARSGRTGSCASSLMSPPVPCASTACGAGSLCGSRCSKKASSSVPFDLGDRKVLSSAL